MVLSLFLLLIVLLILKWRFSLKIKLKKEILKYLEITRRFDLKNIPDKIKPISLLKETEKKILLGLEKFEVKNKFLQKDMTLALLAAQLNTNTKYLSKILNEHKDKNFNGYINELRINYIVNKLRTDPNYLKYKVSYLAEECGFSSHNSFTSVFKKQVGISPIIFIDFVKQEKNNNAFIP